MEATYNCTQQELYGVGNLGWSAVTTYLAQFTAFKAKYVALFVTARKAEITAAELLPDEEQRDEDARTNRVIMKDKATAGMAFFQTLKRYIADAFPKNELEIKYDAAGQAHYAKAGKDDWNAVKRLMLDGNTFITDNTVALSAGDNMPAGFAGDFSDAKDEFDTAYNNYFNASQNSEVDTQAKLVANNAIHEKMMSMFLDGQEIFKTNEAVKKLFTFEQVLLTLTGPGVAGVRGLIKNSVTNQPLLEGVIAHISIFGTDYETDSNEDSRYTLSPVANGTYTLIITCPGFATLQIPGVVIEAGVIKTQNITLVPLP